MGNRAVIQFTETQAVYIHWNGGRDSVEGMLNACKELTTHGWAKEKGAKLFAAVASAYFEEKSAVLLDKPVLLDCDNGDNGLYYVDANKWSITGRMYHEGSEDDDPKKRISVHYACVVNYFAGKGQK